MGDVVSLKPKRGTARDQLLAMVQHQAQGEHQEPGGAAYSFGLEGGGVLWFFNPRSYPPPRLLDALSTGRPSR